MAGQGWRPPAWYRDPHRSDRLRYWDGGDWTNRSRPVPRWAIDDQDTVTLGGRREGPRSAAELPAPTAEVSTGREAAPATPGSAPAGPSNTANSAPGGPIRRPADDGPPGPEGPGGPGGGGGGGGSGDGGSGDVQRHHRRIGVFAFVVIVLSGLAVAIGVLALRPKSYGPRVLTQSSFEAAANGLCDKTLA
jgi:hypothetical protein